MLVSPGVSFLVGPGSGGDVFFSRGSGAVCEGSVERVHRRIVERVQAVGAGKGVLHPSTPKALSLFCFLTTQKRETGWDQCLSLLKVLRVGGSNLTV